ncbi:squalene/phytoene synthase family protein [Hyphobacterium sp.]|uniref:squalene/phytoene synthase family protein n=1 Tax=Hyphobacterium sp. TaxID=2004662 RepID=UPI00374A7C4F
MTNAARYPGSVPDRALAALFAPAGIRQALSDLYAWVEEIESIPFKAREPAIQAMRFAWHREAVADLFSTPRKVRRHAAYEGMAGLLDQTFEIEADELIRIIDGVEDGTLPERLMDEAALCSIMDRRWGTLTKIAARICGGESDEAVIRASARATGLAHWCREFGYRAGTKMALVPENALTAAQFNVHRLASGREPERAHAAFASVIGVLENELTALDAGEKCPPHLFPALAPARLARATLAKAKASKDLYRTDFQRPQIARQFDLLKASLSGRL